MILEIKPQSKERARARGRQFYTPNKTRKYEENIAMLYRANGGEYHKGKIKVYVVFSYATKDCQKMWTSKTSRPDVDNLIKALFDGLNGVAWEDDAQVVEVKASKVWTAYDYIELEIQGERK